MDAPTMDCAVAFERASKAFLLTSEPRFLDSAEKIAGGLASAARDDDIADLECARTEVAMLSFRDVGPCAPRPEE